jgi:hypothetical protein
VAEVSCSSASQRSPLREQPAFALAREGGEIAPERLLQRRGVQRVREREAEGHQALELLGARSRLQGVGGRHGRVRLHELSFAIFVEEEDAGEDGECRHEIDVVTLLDLECGVPDKPQRLLKDHDRTRDEPHDQRRIVACNEAHG